jgi:hypothetical protein
MIEHTPFSLFPEDNLYPLWQDFCNKNMKSFDQRVCGFFPGVLNRFEGPDFQGAEVEIDGIRYRGDVEIHLNLKDWFNHGHHLDSRYDHVVLHLVWHYDEQSCGGSPIVNSKNLVIPTFALQNLTRANPEGEAMDIHSCHLAASKRDQFWTQLQVLAVERLQEKGRQIQNLLAGEGKEQILYQLLVRILGSPNNKDNFEHLASLLPWSQVQLLKRTLHPTIEAWISLFLYIAGFLEHDQQFKFLTQTVRNVTTLYSGSRLSYPLWKTAGQRPWNSPQHRLQGLAHFVHQWNGSSLYHTFRDNFVNRLPPQQLLKTLCTLLAPRPSHFWNDHLYRAQVDPKTFWGQSIQIEIIGNVLVPFFYQEATAAGSDGFADYLEDFYLFLPGSSSYGSLRAFYKWPEWGDLPGRKGFYLNQALLKLLQGFCQQNICTRCPLGRVQEKN